MLKYLFSKSDYDTAELDAARENAMIALMNRVATVVEQTERRHETYSILTPTPFRTHQALG